MCHPCVRTGVTHLSGPYRRRGRGGRGAHRFRAGASAAPGPHRGGLQHGFRNPRLSRCPRRLEAPPAGSLPGIRRPGIRSASVLGGQHDRLGTGSWRLSGRRPRRPGSPGGAGPYSAARHPERRWAASSGREPGCHRASRSPRQCRVPRLRRPRQAQRRAGSAACVESGVGRRGRRPRSPTETREPKPLSIVFVSRIVQPAGGSSSRASFSSARAFRRAESSGPLQHW